MSETTVVTQQVINGLSLGGMYALLALGFTLVYGIIELINFAHFNVFMIGSFIGMWVLQAFGLSGQSVLLTGLPLAGALVAALIVSMFGSGMLGVAIERYTLRPLRGKTGSAGGTVGMITTIGVSYILFNVILLGFGADTKNFPDPLPIIQFKVEGANLDLRVILIWLVSIVLMVGLWLFVQKSKLGKAMRAVAQDAEAARMMGVDVDRAVIMAFFWGSALAGAAGLIFGLYYNFTSFLIGYTAGLRAFTAAVLGGIGNIPGAMLGGLIIGLIEALGGQFIAVKWTDVIIFAILVFILVLKPTGLLGTMAPSKS